MHASEYARRDYRLHRAPVPEEAPLEPLPGEEPAPDEEELPPHPNPSLPAQPQ